MNALAQPWHNGGPGPWIFFFPFLWAAVVIGVVRLLRRTGRLGRGPWGPRSGLAGPGPDGQSPLTLLGRRFAAGEIDEDEYWRRLSVLDQEFGTRPGRER